MLLSSRDNRSLTLEQEKQYSQIWAAFIRGFRKFDESQKIFSRSRNYVTGCVMRSLTKPYGLVGVIFIKNVLNEDAYLFIKQSRLSPNQRKVQAKVPTYTLALSWPNDVLFVDAIVIFIDATVVLHRGGPLGHYEIWVGIIEFNFCIFFGSKHSDFFHVFMFYISH